MTRTLGASVLAAALLAGCGGPPDAESSGAAADEMRADVQKTLSELADGLRERGVEVTAAKADWRACGLTTPQLGYAAGMGTTTSSGSVDDQLAAAREVIEGLDLPMEEIEGARDIATDPSESDLRVSAKESRLDPGTLDIEVVRDCVELDKDVMDEKINERPEELEP